MTTPLPDFIEPGIWEFRCTIKPEQPILGGFHPDSAREAMHLTGYYLFTELGRGSVELAGVRHARAA